MLTTVGSNDLAGAVWIDMVDPTDADADAVRAATGLRVPRMGELAEIETSSRLRREGDAIYLSVPALSPLPGGATAPVGYVLTPTRLLTVRFTHLPSFEARLAAAAHEPAGSAGHFVALLEAIVDHIADVLEHHSTALDGVSGSVFRPALAARRPAQADRRLRGVLVGLGETGDGLGRLRDTLLGLSRAAPYVLANATHWIEPDARERLETLRADLASLSDYDARLSDKVQFLLDATLGFINIEQNNIIKVLTIVSIVGIPPTFIASLYGMNFKDIPELGWSFGYWYALALMAVTAAAPIVWFRIKGWL